MCIILCTYVCVSTRIRLVGIQGISTHTGTSLILQRILYVFFLISLQINTRYHNALSSYTGSTAGEIQLMGMTCPLVEPLAA